MKTFSIKKPNLIAIMGSFLPVWLFSRSDAISATSQFRGCLEINHTGRKLPTMTIRLGFLIENFSYNYLLELFIGISIQILIFLSAVSH